MTWRASACAARSGCSSTSSSTPQYTHSLFGTWGTPAGGSCTHLTGRPAAPGWTAGRHAHPWPWQHHRHTHTHGRPACGGVRMATRAAAESALRQMYGRPLTRAALLCLRRSLHPAAARVQQASICDSQCWPAHWAIRLCSSWACCCMRCCTYTLWACTGRPGYWTVPQKGGTHAMAWHGIGEFGSEVASFSRLPSGLAGTGTHTPGVA